MYTETEFNEIKLDHWTTFSRFKTWITDLNPHESQTLNRWFKFEPAATLLEFIKFGSRTDLKFITLIFHKEAN